MSNILIGITGGISAYKMASVVSVLHDKGHNVRVIMTENAKKFITPLTMASLSHNEIFDDALEFSSRGHITHVELAKWATLFVIAPLTANTGVKLENCSADNLLTSTVLAYEYGVITFPAMNNVMWQKYQEKYIRKTTNINYLSLAEANISKSLGYLRYRFPQITYVQPETGKMACGDSGEGKLPDTKTIVSIIEKLLMGY